MAPIDWRELIDGNSSNDKPESKICPGCTEENRHSDFGRDTRPSWDKYIELPFMIGMGQLRCPVCGALTIEGGDQSGDVETVPDKDDYEPGNPLSTRGGYTIVHMWCNCSTHLALITAQHKGSVYHKLLAASDFKSSRHDPECSWGQRPVSSDAGKADGACGINKNGPGWCAFANGHQDSCFFICLECGEPLNGSMIYCNEHYEEFSKMRAKAQKIKSPIEQAFWSSWLKLDPRELRGLEPQFPFEQGRYLIDFALPFKKVGIELDGLEHHSSTADIAKDRRRQRELEQAGWRIIRFGGAEVHHDSDGCVREAAALIRQWEAEARGDS